MRVHQMTNGMMLGDAVANQCLEIETRLQAWGYETALYAQYVAPEMKGRVLPDREFAPYLNSPDDLLIYHYSIYVPNVRLFRAARGRKVMIYHNITPPEFFFQWDNQQAVLCALGRNALQTLYACDLALGDSEFDRQELIAAGFQADRTGVLPIILPQRRYESLRPNEALRTRLRVPGMTNWLTVGRVVPNKALEDLIRLFHVYARYVNPDAHLYIVGSRYIRSYDEALADLIADLDLVDQITLVGRVSEADLMTYYQAADLYLCTSRHEGFCVPLIESMYFGVPILARKAAAIPETLGNAGVLFTDLDYPQIAEAAHILVTDATLRQSVIDRQKARLLDLRPERSEAVLRELLQRLGC